MCGDCAASIRIWQTVRSAIPDGWLAGAGRYSARSNTIPETRMNDATESAGDIDLARLREWVGRSVEDSDVLSVRHARLMAATLGSDPSRLDTGAPLPSLWHWLY